MSEDKFTPGPWRIVREGRGRVLVKPQKSDGLGTQIAQLFSYQETTVENVGNARLIAAAPALYEACKVMQESLNGSPGNFTVMLEAHRKLDAAIALATNPVASKEVPVGF